MEQLVTRALEQLDPYTQAFVATVLSLRGVDGPASLEQLKGALRILDEFQDELAAAVDRGDPVEEDWLAGLSLEYAAQQHAFYFVQFGNVGIPTAEQTEALHHWRVHPARPH
jgi:hypothetical protein